MKLQKFKADAAGSAIGTVLGVATGAMLSGGVSGAIPVNNKTVVKAIVAITGVALATLVGGQDTAAKVVRNIGIGMSAQQSKEILSENLKPMLPADTNVATKFLHDSLGSGQSMSSGLKSALAARIGRSRKRMGNPNLEFQMAIPEINQGGFAAI